MSDENSPAAVTAMRDPDSALARENADLRARLEALERQNVIEGHFQGEAPKYQLNEPCYLEDTLYPAGSTIEYTGVPNLDMAPQNEPARERMQAHIDALVDGQKRVAMSRGREFTGLVTDRGVLIDLANLDAKNDAQAPVPVIAMPTVHAAPPPMPHTEEAKAIARRGPGRPKKVISSQPPAPMRPGPDLGAPLLAPAPGPAIVGRRVS